MTRPALPIVERLEALMAAATKGPYRAHDHNSMARVGEKPENWIGYAWVGRIKENSGPDGSFDAGWLDLDRRKDGCKEYRERASADAHFVAEALNALPELLAIIDEQVGVLKECEAVLRDLCPRIPHDGPSTAEEQEEYERIGFPLSRAQSAIAKAGGQS